MAVRVCGEDTLFRPESSQEEEEQEEGEVTPPPISLSREALPLLGDIFLRQVGVTVDAHRSKQTQI
jgi:hypothetical protein